MTAIAEDLSLLTGHVDSRGCEGQLNNLPCSVEAVVLAIWDRSCCGTFDALLCGWHRDYAIDTDVACNGCWHCTACAALGSARLIRLVPLR